jgi:hypothetical protein
VINFEKDELDELDRPVVDGVVDCTNFLLTTLGLSYGSKIVES